MKLTAHFDTFLSDVVNLNETRITTLKDRVEAIENVISLSAYKPRLRRFRAQGSWAHKTIIKPPKDNDFDADLVVFLDRVEGWVPADYVKELYAIFRAHGTYKDKTSLETRCVTINYKGEFHLDLIPCVQEIADGVYSYEVCNRIDDKFEPTNPEKYNDWFNGKNNLVGNDQLRKITRLLKYLRDVKGNFSVKSILLTTLVGQRITAVDQFARLTHFCDLPTSLRTLAGRLDDQLQSCPTMITVENPTVPGEKFTRHWDQDKYANFREKIHLYRGWIDEAYAETDRNESIRKWRRVFGDDFAEGEIIEKASRVSEIALNTPGSSSRGLVEAIKRGASSLLYRIPATLPHVMVVPWRSARQTIPVVIRASEHRTKRGDLLRQLSSGDVIAKDQWINFVANSPVGLPNTFDVEWRVVNTGEEASRKRGLRGDFYKSDSHANRWERTEYTGVHWVEAFVVNRRTNECVGRSERFFVVIE